MDSLPSQSSSTWHTFASVKRQPQQQPTRDTQPWTTTRCHRLLRPLKTHISALRREKEQESSELMSDDGSGDGSVRAHVAQSPKTTRFQRTYSRRGRKPASTTSSQAAPQRVAASRTRKTSMRHVVQPGEIVLPTPFIRRARGQQLSSPIQQPVLKGHMSKVQPKRSTCAALYLPGSPDAVRPCSLVSALEIEMLPLRSRITSTRFSLYESILRALHALLVATATPTTFKFPVGRLYMERHSSAKSSTKSLMAMCLRKVPDYIDGMEFWEQQEAENEGTKSTLQSSEASTQVYEALIDMLPPSSRGCPQLRTVVREHGMKLVRDAATEGLLEDSLLLLLIALCFRTKSYLEAETLFEIILDRCYPKPKNVDSTFDESRRLAPMKTLRDFARESCRPQFMHRQLSKLVTTQQLPVEWLSTKEFASIWSGVVKTLSEDAVCDDTILFAVHFIRSLSFQAKISTFTLRPERGDLKSLSQQTLLSAITALVSLILLRQEANHLAIQGAACVVLKRVEYIIGACIKEMSKSRKPGWISTILNLAAYFASVTRTGSNMDVSETWHRILQERDRRDGKQHYEAATSLLCSLASCCARGTSEPSHYYLTRFFQQLDSEAAVEGSKSSILRTDCAFFLADRTSDLRDLFFAESFSNTASSGTRSAEITPRKTSTSSSLTDYRWDGDISEWVTATPEPESSRSTQTHQDETDEDDGVSDFRASLTKCHGTHITSPRRLRKRSLTAVGLLCLQPSTDEEDSKETDKVLLSRNGRQYRRASGQQNKSGGVFTYVDSKKRRRVAAAETVPAAPLKPRRAVLRTMYNTGREDLSDDELGL